MAAARGTGAVLDGHDPEEAPPRPTGGTCMTEWETGGSIRRHDLCEMRLIEVILRPKILFSKACTIDQVGCG